MNNIECKVCIIGAGPAGLLTYDYLAQYNIPTVVFESSCSYGGQCTAFYRNKQINGIPGLYNTSAGEFIQNIYNQCINKNNIILNANIKWIIILDISSIATVYNNVTSSNQPSLQSVIPNNVVLLHRRDKLKCNQNKLKLLNKVDVKLNQNILEIRKNLVITDKEEIHTNNVIFCYGFTYNNNFLQQLSKFGLLLDNNLINIDLNSMETSLKHCYAVGDVVKYPLKKKNIISCCFEAARVVNTILNKESLC